MSFSAAALALLIAPGMLVSDGPTDKPAFALTYDDGPGSSTDGLLKTLDEEGVKATFFVLGKSVRAHPGAVARIAAAGHLVALHTDTHPNFVKVAEDRREGLLRREISACRKAVEGEKVTPAPLLRMPHGYDRPWVNQVAKDEKLVLVNWTYGSDWTDIPEAGMVEGYLQHVREGAILLLHDGGAGGKRAARLTKAILKRAREKGLRPVRLDELLGY